MPAPPFDHPTLAGKTICLVTSGHVGSNPRLVKEADALAGAGARVTVVAVNITRLAEVQERDRFTIGRGLWPCVLVDGGRLPLRMARALAQRLARYMVALGIRSDRATLHAFNRMIVPLARAATKQRADLYIAHNLAALPAAHQAAAAHGAKLGFDAEDFHTGELAQTPGNAMTVALTKAIEQRYLPLCDYLTAASPGIASAYAAAYAMGMPTSILNVFPHEQAPLAATRHGDAALAPSLYWFSQTVGPGRGLELVLRAIAASRSRPSLHLQGTLAKGYRDELAQLASKLGLQARLVFHPPALPEQLPRLAARYDVGLATEPPDSLNRDLCLSNKLFTYLLAGIPILATNTAAQTGLAQQLPGAMAVAPIGDVQHWAEAIDAFLLDPDALAAARRASWDAGQRQFHWDQEKARFLDVIARTLA
jgi:glycosyltransferase involved in cell wall biosynthesis